MKKHLTSILLLVVFLAGLSVLLYPTISDYINSMTQSRVIINYSDAIAQMDNEDYRAALDNAHNYNDRLRAKSNRFKLSESDLGEYNSLLNVGGNGVMGYIEIPAINVKLPIYHGTDEAVLQVGIGHLEGTSLPVGGIGTHAAITGHRGLPSALLLSHIDRLTVGDRFKLNILDEVLTYEVDQIVVVLPDEMSDLGIDPDKDYVTLISCTPYGINSHRMLVRGYRVDTVVERETQQIRVSADARQVDFTLVSPFIAAPMLAAMVIYIFIKYRKPKERS